MICPVCPDDLEEIGRWLMAHTGKPLNRECLSPLGLWEPGVAAGFLILTSAGVAMLDGFVTNPEAPYRARRAALTGIIERLVGIAERQGYKRVFGLTVAHGIVGLVKKIGFREAGSFRVMVREAQCPS